MERESKGDANCNRCSRYRHQRNSTGTGRIENKNTSGDHPSDSTIKIGQITEKSLEETCCHTKSSEKPSANAGVKNSQKSTLIHTVKIYSQDIEMEFGIEKCALLVMKCGKRYLTE